MRTSGEPGGLEGVVVDEWHELLGTKRGVQTELCLARLRGVVPELRIWGLSATLGNTGGGAGALARARRAATACRFPATAEEDRRSRRCCRRASSASHGRGTSGTRSVAQVIDALERAHRRCCSPTRDRRPRSGSGQLLERDRSGSDEIAHPPRLARPQAVRREVEERLREGTVRCVVCTSTLDLGVDFTPVEQVIQVGSPKGIARLMQRAGRSGHSPGGHCAGLLRSD